MPAASGMKIKIHDLKPTCPVQCDHQPETWRLRIFTLGVCTVFAICIAAGFLMFLFIFDRETAYDRGRDRERGRYCSF